MGEEEKEFRSWGGGFVTVILSAHNGVRMELFGKGTLTMKKLLGVAVVCALGLTAFAQALPAQEDVVGIMRRVADWQILHQPNVGHSPRNWTNGALYIGMLDWGELAEKLNQDTSYIRWVEGIGDGAQWSPSNPKDSHADNFTVCQAWLRLYRRFGMERRMKPTRALADAVIAKPPTVALDLHNWGAVKRWSWCDALYMAPQVYAMLSQITKDPKYITYMEQEWKATTDYLYDKEEKLFFRDSRYFPDAANTKPDYSYREVNGKTGHYEANGRKVFWGRGNGWVIGGLANLLRILPKDYANRAYYENLYKEFAMRLVELQSADGYWRASLLDPESFPSPETSGTGFIVYGLAWGVNEGLLDREVVLPAVLKGWKALCDAVDAKGKLGYVQPVGQDPRKVTRGMTEVYGVGAFLQAGTQIYRLATPAAK